MMPRRSRVLDASALVALFHNHPQLFRFLAVAEAGEVSLVVPAGAILEAQVVVRSTSAAWNSILTRDGVVELPLGAQAAREAGEFARPRMELELPHRVLTGPPMVAQVLREALIMRAVVVTAVPEAYRGHAVAVNVI